MHTTTNLTTESTIDYLIIEGDGGRLAPAGDVSELQRAAPRHGGKRSLVEGVAVGAPHVPLSHWSLIE